MPAKKKTLKKIKKIKPIVKKAVLIKKTKEKKNQKIKKNILKKSKINKVSKKEAGKKNIVKILKEKPIILKKEVKIKKIKESKVLPQKQNFVFSPEAVFKAKIKVVGIGGGGGSIVSEIGRYLQKATFLIADTDIRALKKRNGLKHFWFGENLTHGLGTGVDVDLANQAAKEVKDKFKTIFEGQDIVIFVASLGGGLGSGATQVFVDAVKEYGGITLGIFTLPFKFEGKNKNRIAQNALKSLRQSLNISLVIPNEKIFKIIDANTPITDAFSRVNKSLIGFLESLIDLIYNPGVINIDFADLKSILKGQGNQVFLNTIEESGKDRAEKTCQNIFLNPLLQTSTFTAQNILFNISGSENLSMFEVEKISSKISEMNPKAKIIFGISKNPKLKTKIKTTILATGPGNETQMHSQTSVVKNTKEKSVLQVTKDNANENLVKENKNQQKVNLEKKKIDIKKEQKINRNNKVKKLPVPNNDKKVVKIPEESLENKFVPGLEDTVLASASLTEKKLSIIDSNQLLNLNKNTSISRHSTIRRSGLEIKKAQDQEEKKRLDQEKEWEIPAFLRRVKYKS